MATYVVLATFTDQGVKNAKDSPKRAEASKQMAETFGVTVKDIFWTQGRYALYRVPHALVDRPGRLRRGLHLERQSDRRQVISIWHSWQDDRGIRTPEQYRR